MAQASDIVNSNWSPGQAMPGKEPSVKMRTPLISEVLKNKYFSKYNNFIQKMSFKVQANMHSSQPHQPKADIAPPLAPEDEGSSKQN